MEQRRAVAATLSLFRDMGAQEGKSIIRQGDMGAVARGGMGAGSTTNKSITIKEHGSRGRQRKAGTAAVTVLRGRGGAVLRGRVVQY